MIDWDARTRLPGQHTRVRRSEAGRTPQTAGPCRVVPRGDSRIGPTRPKSGRLGPYRPKRPSQAEIQKKKGAKRTV